MTRFLHTIAWGNPHTQPPEGAPRLLLVVETDSGVTPTEIVPLWSQVRGYAMGCQPLEDRPPRRWSAGARGRVRRANLRRRLGREHPLFAMIFQGNRSPAAATPIFRRNRPMADFTAFSHRVLAVPCPDCRARAGAWCARPPGHRASDFHAAREAEADRVFLEQHGPDASIIRDVDGWRVDPRGKLRD